MVDGFSSYDLRSEGHAHAIPNTLGDFSTNGTFGTRYDTDTYIQAILSYADRSNAGATTVLVDPDAPFANDGFVWVEFNGDNAATQFVRDPDASTANQVAFIDNARLTAKLRGGTQSAPFFAEFFKTGDDSQPINIVRNSEAWGRLGAGVREGSTLPRNPGVGDLFAKTSNGGEGLYVAQPNEHKVTIGSTEYTSNEITALMESSRRSTDEGHRGNNCYGFWNGIQIPNLSPGVGAPDNNDSAVVAIMFDDSQNSATSNGGTARPPQTRVYVDESKLDGAAPSTIYMETQLAGTSSIRAVSGGLTKQSGKVNVFGKELTVYTAAGVRNLWITGGAATEPWSGKRVTFRFYNASYAALNANARGGIILPVYREVFWRPKGADPNRNATNPVPYTEITSNTNALLATITDFNFQAGKNYRVTVDLDCSFGFKGYVGTTIAPWRRELMIADSGNRWIFFGEEVSFTFTSVGGEGITINGQRPDAKTSGTSYIQRGFVRCEELNTYENRVSRF